MLHSQDKSTSLVLNYCKCLVPEGYWQLRRGVNSKSQNIGKSETKLEFFRLVAGKQKKTLQGGNGFLEQHNNILFIINQQNKFAIFNKINRVHFISEKKENGGNGLTIHLFTHSHQTSTAQHLRPARHLSILPSRATSAFLRNTQLTSQDQLSCTLLENMWKISEHILFFSLFTWIHRTVTL